MTEKDFIPALKLNIMTKSNQYNNVALPSDLIEKIDSVIKSSKMGYKSRGEFVKEAVRKLLKEINKL
jgi:metal-responsive CopG/Arc/MetJ family transcriptional regulator